MKLILTFEEYQEFLNKTGIKELVQNLIEKNLCDKVGNLLKDRDEQNETDLVVKKNVMELFPVESSVKRSLYAKQVTAGYSSWINAYSAMQQPEHFAKVINAINKELGRSGEQQYDIGDPEFKMLGLANRYAENAANCKTLYQWDRYNFYMSMLVYFLPFLVEQAGLSEQDLDNLMSKPVPVEIESKVKPGARKAVKAEQESESFSIYQDDDGVTHLSVTFDVKSDCTHGGNDLVELNKRVADFISRTKCDLKQLIETCDHCKQGEVSSKFSLTKASFDPSSLDEKIDQAKKAGNQVLVNRLEKLAKHFKQQRVSSNKRCKR